MKSLMISRGWLTAEKEIFFYFQRARQLYINISTHEKMYRWGGELGVLLTWMWWNTLLSSGVSVLPPLPLFFGVYSCLLPSALRWCGPYVVLSMKHKRKKMRGGVHRTWWRARAVCAASQSIKNEFRPVDMNDFVFVAPHRGLLALQ